MGSSENPKPPQRIGNGKYEIDKKLGAGCFGEVWLGHDSTTKEHVAVKFEDFQGHALQLEHEVEILKVLSKNGVPQGFTECLYWGHEGRYHCMVMELLGRSLEECMQKCRGKFQVTTAVLIAEQVLRRIEFLHSKGLVHRDIKPENFMFGTKDKIHHLYLIDFGLSKRYYDQKHVQIRTKLSLTGTARYASINAHKGIEQSRRDDLEAIGHMLLYFLRGSLPWSGLEAKTQEEKYRKIREKKEVTPLDDLCAGFPDAFKTYLRTSRDLEFKERPDYNALRKLFNDVRLQQGQIEDHQYQWFDGKDLGKLTPVEKVNNLRQPDDQAPKRGFCGCFGGSAVKE
jgi:serine/threonine protein kinase